MVAGAGSGKTRVITARIANLLINENVAPHALVALTFTNKAAKEMQERITQFLGKGTILPFIGTFHSYCVNLLKRNQELLDIPFFSIIDEDDKQKLISGIIQRSGMQKQVTAKQLAYQVSQIKNKTADPGKLAAMYAKNPMLNELFNSYEREKKASKCFDFDDLLLEAVRLFKKNKNFKEEFQDTVGHLLIDEYQDTNVVQHALLKHMCKKGKAVTLDSICVVGDEDQSIYSWRGATIANILNFKKDFPKTVTIKIEQNYRSVKPILETANHVIKHNRFRNPKKLWSDKKATDRVRCITCMSEYQEGDVIVQLLQVVQKHKKLSDVAILYRTHFQSRAIEEALIKNSIPYKIIGGTQFYDRKEIKDLLGYLRLIVNPYDRASFFRVINSPTRGFGKKFEEIFYDRWHNESFLTFHEVANNMIKDGTVAKTKKTSLKDFLKIFSGLDANTQPTKALDAIISKTGYLHHLKTAHEKEEALNRIDNIKELNNAIKHVEAEGTTTLAQFLEDVALMQEKMNKKGSDKDSVLLMTLHAAKGLEFDTVIVSGLEEGLLPSSRSLQVDKQVEEERRLFYVGITRAKERLLLTNSRYRYAYRNMVDQLPSRFVDELPTNIVSFDNCSYWKAPKLKTYFSDWLGVKIENPFSVFTFGGAKTSGKKAKPSYKKSTKKFIAARKAPSRSGWRKNQTVKHEKFGMGLVKSVEEKSSKKTYLTVQFKSGTKKIDAKFVQRI